MKERHDQGAESRPPVPWQQPDPTQLISVRSLRHLCCLVTMAASLISPLGNSFENKYAEELVKTARAIAAPGKGILAADESTGTIGKRVRCSDLVT